MLRLYWYSLKQAIRSRSEMFWSLAFPLLLATLFFLTFGDENLDEMNPVPVAVVSGGNSYFEQTLEEMDGTVLEIEHMEEKDALTALREGKLDGIFYSTGEPSLTVTGVDLEQSILQVVLDNYLEYSTLVQNVGETNPLKLLTLKNELTESHNYIRNTSVGGNSVNENLNYFFALISMACLFGSFMGMTAAMNLRADRTPLAARRSIVPVNRLALVVSEMLAIFTVQFVNVCILLGYLHFILGISFGDNWLLIWPVCILGSMTGVAFGITIGSLRLGEGPKTGILIGGSLFMSFLSGLMFANMKDIVEQKCPILNRINPASLISDAFYSISVYDNPQRYGMNLLLLSGITVLLILASFLLLWRERYDSL